MNTAQTIANLMAERQKISGWRFLLALTQPKGDAGKCKGKCKGKGKGKGRKGY